MFSAKGIACLEYLEAENLGVVWRLKGDPVAGPVRDSGVGPAAGYGQGVEASASPEGHGN